MIDLQRLKKSTLSPYHAEGNIMDNILSIKSSADGFMVLGPRHCRCVNCRSNDCDADVVLDVCEENLSLFLAAPELLRLVQGIVNVLEVYNRNLVNTISSEEEDADTMEWALASIEKLIEVSVK